MTDIAVSLIDPLPVTVQTLLVVSASKGRLVDVRLAWGDVMTGFTGRMLLTSGSIVMTRHAATRHLRHLRMPLVIEWYRQVRILQFIENDHLRPLIIRQENGLSP